MSRKNTAYFQTSFILISLSVVACPLSAADYSYGQNRYRPLEQDKDGFRQQKPVLESHEFVPRGLSAGGERGGGYQPGAVVPPQTSTPYKFRALPGQPEVKQKTLQFRPDPRLDGRGENKSTAKPKPKRWTGNDVIAPVSPGYGPDASYPYSPSWPQNHSYPNGHGTYPYGPDYYYPRGGVQFPWSGFMPSFSW